MLPRFLQLTSILLALASPLRAADWVRGALTLHEVAREVVVSELGGSATAMRAGDAPVSMSALVNCEAAHGASAFFSASNRSYLFFEGGGSFALERFEQDLPDGAAWRATGREVGQSRTIVNLRSGRIAIDARNMSDASQYLVETPLGRITVRRALWQMRIGFDPRSQMFDFTITCSDGRVRFTDLQGRQYTLRTGQRLSGAGAKGAPSIEVGENTARTREQMQQFRQLIDTHATAAGELEAYQPYFRVIHPGVEVAAPAAMPSRQPDSGRRPIVIEHAKDPAPVTPFRGEVSAPPVPETDLF